ncbi:hypothetical protein M2271_006362 [Streptomyces sp. LBL]|nr:hypothetical protein [Streptomyces sp. LBL]
MPRHRASTGTDERVYHTDALVGRWPSPAATRALADGP